jgi:hypothetical protein
VFGWARGQRGGGTWTAAVPRFRSGSRKVEEQPQWPDFLGGIEVHRHDGWRPGATMAVITERRRGALTGLLRVTGREFALIDRAEQERLLAGWGDALGAFCKERTSVEAVRWFEWSAPADASDHVRWSRDHVGWDADPAAVADYLEMVEKAGPMSTRHESIVSVTIASPGRSLVRRLGERRDRALVETLRDELRLLATRLESAGLAVDPVLTVEETTALIRSRLDPFGTAPERGGVETLAQMAGVTAVRNTGPLATRTEWGHVAVDSAVHACFAVVEWPRLDVPPNWMEPLLLHAGGTRTVAMHLEPVPPSRSQRQVDKDSTRLVVDAEQRSKSGFRIGARHRRAESDVAARESELVAGYSEFEYCGLVAVTAPDLETLERTCAEWEQVAAHSGIQLRRLYGQHDRALACTLPLGIGPSKRSWE